MLFDLLFKALLGWSQFSLGGGDSPSFVHLQNLLDPSQTREGAEQLFEGGLDFFEQGAQQFLQPSFDFARQLIDPLSGLVGGVGQSAFRRAQENLLENVFPAQEQLFQSQGAFFTPDLTKSRSGLIEEFSAQQGDFLNNLTFGLGQLGVGAFQNILNANLGQSQFGANLVNDLIASQLGIESANVATENQRRQIDFENRGSGQDLFGNLLSLGSIIAAPFTAGTSLAALPFALGTAGAATSAFGPQGGGIGDFFTNLAVNQFIGNQLGGFFEAKPDIFTSAGPGFRNTGPIGFSGTGGL